MNRLLICIMSIFSLLSCADRRRTMPEGRLTEYSYIVQGMMSRPLVSLNIKESPEGCILTCSTERDTCEHTVKVGREVLENVRSLISEHKMYKYKEAYKSRFQILDGETWSFYAHFSDGPVLRSGGSNAWPANAGLFAIEDYLLSLAGK